MTMFGGLWGCPWGGWGAESSGKRGVKKKKKKKKRKKMLERGAASNYFVAASNNNFSEGPLKASGGKRKSTNMPRCETGIEKGENGRGM
jgi:hypothetical protein